MPASPARVRAVCRLLHRGVLPLGPRQDPLGRSTDARALDQNPEQQTVEMEMTLDDRLTVGFRKEGGFSTCWFCSGAPPQCTVVVLELERHGATTDWERTYTCAYSTYCCLDNGARVPCMVVRPPCCNTNVPWLLEDGLKDVRVD
jgi:hypothetical protein